jgi:hypothetical protein
MGRHKEEIGTPVGVRIRSAELAELDAWCSRHGLNRQDAIRKLVRDGIHGDTPEIPDETKIRDDTNSPGAIDAKEREELEHLRRLAPAMQARLAGLEAEIRSTVCETELENEELKRRLSPTNDTPAHPSPWEKLLPEHRAALEWLLAKNRLAGVLEKTAKKIKPPTTTPEIHVTPARPPLKQETSTDAPLSQVKEFDFNAALKGFSEEIATVPEQMPVPDIESEVDFFARLKAIRDDPNKSPAQIQREQRAELDARADKQRQIKRAEEFNRRLDDNPFLVLDFDSQDTPPIEEPN